ncbi:HHE domain-containing protein [Stachybotrys elegans]|uniref:HHE domain-containing protein n=1 Tax=Stachybotrys elegans TaxID=80388 RepID=A0A8K0STW8_9HYPO|nr:HHE domain-containing protein [Stachybotrys elegans]
MTIGQFYLTDAIKRDHRKLENLYAQIIETKEPQEKTRIMNSFVGEVARHCAVEELIVHPALRNFAAKGEQLALEDREAHKKVKECLSTLYTTPIDDDGFTPCLENLSKFLRQHITDGERKYLAALESGLSEAQSEDLAKAFTQCKDYEVSKSATRTA